MAILATDILLKTMFEAAFIDLKKNAWILDDIFNGLENDAMSKEEYGNKEVKRAKQWFLDSRPEVYLHTRVDNPTFPCITIVQAASNEMPDRASLGQEGHTESFDPKVASIGPQMIYKPFTPKSYAAATGTVTFPDGIDTGLVVVGQFLVAAKTGKAYQILKITGNQSFQIKANTSDDLTGAYIVPQIALWNLQREQTFLEETYAIGVHAASEPVNCIWLRQIILYIMFRYQEAYLEGRGFELSIVSGAQGVDRNPHFDKEIVYSCIVNISGQTEANWIKYVAPKLQSVKANIKIVDGPLTPPGYIAPVKDQGWEMEEDDED